MKIVLYTIRCSSKVLHLSLLLLQFVRKIPLNSSWRPLAWRKDEPSFMKNVSQNATKHLLHAICRANQFHCFIPVSLWFACSPLKSEDQNYNYEQYEQSRRIEAFRSLVSLRLLFVKKYLHELVWKMNTYRRHHKKPPMCQIMHFYFIA